MRCWTREPTHERRLVCLPSAGALAAGFMGLARALPPGIDVWTVEQPGRGSRRSEPSPTSVEAAAGIVIDALRDEPPVPTVLLGHSYGGLVALEVARRLPGDVVGLVVGHTRAPDRLLHVGEERWETTDDDALVAQLHRLGATPPGLLDDPGARDMFLPAIRADLDNYAAYRHPPLPCLTVPVFAVGAVEDPLVARRDLLAWRTVTTGSFTAMILPGGHFLPMTDAGAFAAAVEPIVSRSMFGRSPEPAGRG